MTRRAVRRPSAARRRPSSASILPASSNQSCADLRTDSVLMRAGAARWRQQCAEDRCNARLTRLACPPYPGSTFSRLTITAAGDSCAQNLMTSQGCADLADLTCIYEFNAVPATITCVCPSSLTESQTDAALRQPNRISAHRSFRRRLRRAGPSLRGGRSDRLLHGALYSRLWPR